MSPTLLLYVSVLIRNLMALIDLKGLMHRYLWSNDILCVETIEMVKLLWHDN